MVKIFFLVVSYSLIIYYGLSSTYICTINSRIVFSFFIILTAFLLSHIVSSQLFLANPHKPPLVIEIFQRNKPQLLDYIENFHPKEEDEQLEEEKEYLIDQLNKL